MCSSDLLHREKVEKVGKWLARDFQCKLKAVTPLMLVEWFAKIPGSETQRATVYRYVRLFFNWTVKVDLLEKSPFRAVDCPRARARKDILGAGEMRELLKTEMSDSMRAAILLGGFAGLRSIEVQRMNWEADIVTGKDRKSTRLNSSHSRASRMPSSA